MARKKQRSYIIKLIIKPVFVQKFFVKTQAVITCEIYTKPFTLKSSNQAFLFESTLI